MSSNHKLQAQFKSGEFEFVAAGGDTPQEFEQALGALVAALPLVREVQAELALGQGSQPHPTAQPVQPATQNGWDNPPAPAPATNGSASGVPGVSCIHGPMTRRTGNSSRGPWTGYFCSQPKGSPDQCKARFE